MQHRPRLFCLPPAGAGPSLYRPWVGRHAAHVEVVPVSLPGRESRISEPLSVSLDALAERLAEELEPQLNGRFALFGYSMGAVLGLELARRWEDWGLPTPDLMFLLACNAPDRLLAGREPIHRMEAAAFRQTLHEIGGTPLEILENEEAMALFEPVLRNDFRICETYEASADGRLVECGAHVFVADRDNLVQWDNAARWAHFVGGDVQMHGLHGNHMLERPAFDALFDRALDLWFGVRSAAAAPAAAFG